MADVAVGGPLAVDRLAIGGSWTPVSNSNTPSNQRAAAAGADGDEIASELYDAKEEISDEYVCTAETGSLAIPDVGDISGGYLITGVSISYDPVGWPKMTVTAHQHGANTHTAATAVYAGSVTLPAQFGIPTMGTLGEVAGKAECSYELACQHVDELDGEGGHLCGACYDGHEKLTLGFTGTPTTPFTDAATWDLVTTGATTAGNTTFDKISYSYEKKVTRT